MKEDILMLLWGASPLLVMLAVMMIYLLIEEFAMRRDR